MGVGLAMWACTRLASQRAIGGGILALSAAHLAGRLWSQVSRLASWRSLQPSSSIAAVSLAPVMTGRRGWSRCRASDLWLSASSPRAWPSRGRSDRAGRCAADALPMHGRLAALPQHPEHAPGRAVGLATTPQVAAGLSCRTMPPMGRAISSATAKPTQFGSSSWSTSNT